MVDAPIRMEGQDSYTSINPAEFYETVQTLEKDKTISR